MVGVNIGKDQLELIAGRTIKDADADIDDSINFQEFKRVCFTTWETIPGSQLENNIWKASHL